MSDDAFRGMVAWWLVSHAGDTRTTPDEIERLYREAHPPKVTAEDVIFEARWDMGNFSSSLAAGVTKDECRASNDYRHSCDLSAEDWHATLLYVAKACADLRNAAREDEDEAWIEEAMRAICRSYEVCERRPPSGAMQARFEDAIRAAYRSRSKA